MDVVGTIIRNLTHDLYLLRDGYNLRPLRRHLADSQYLSVSAHQSMQNQRVRRILAHAFQHNAFHRNRFLAAGLTLTDIANQDVLTSLPIMTKEDIRSYSKELFSQSYGPGNTIHKRTGGSTGVPLHVYIDAPAIAFKKALTERHNSWAGLRPGDRVASVWGDTDKHLSLRVRLRNALTERAIYLDTLQFTEEKIAAFVRRVITCRPRVLYGHAHSIFRFAEYIRDRQITLPKFAGIITTAMTLSEEERRTIQGVLGSPVFDRYGCEEISIIASECAAHDGLHIASEGVLVEVHDHCKGDIGRIIVTDLVNLAMPLIRYEIGDFGKLASGNCRCGRSLPRLREVSGRIADFLYTPQREPVFGISILDTFVIHIPGVKQIQIVQDRYDHIDIHLVREATFSDETLERLRAAVAEVFTHSMRFDIHYVDAIQLTERGKYRFSICRIPEIVRPSDAW